MNEFLVTLLKATLIQVASIFGIFFILGFILSQVQEATHRIYLRTIGWKGILATAWIGTPIHELGHVFFAKIFRHKVMGISLFSPNEVTGGLGHVEHSYSRLSVYQNIGNFFIGAAPLIWGSSIMLVLLYFLIPNGREVFHLFQSSYTLETDGLKVLRSISETLFRPENRHTLSFWIFLYVSFCVASHLAPSKQDRKIMWKGFVWIIVILLIVNAIFLWQKKEILFSFSFFSLPLLVSIFLYALFLSVIHWCLALVILRLPRLLWRR